jgi:DNA polymerase-3 subunit delta
MITTLIGDNDFLIKEYIDNLKAQYINDHGDMAVEQIDCEESEVDKITDSIINLPFLVPNKLVVLYYPSKNKQFTDVFENIINLVPEQVRVVFVDTKVDKRSVYYKLLKNKTELVEFNKINDFEIHKWIFKYVEELGGSISQTDAKYLADYIGNNQIKLSNEIKKLIIYDKLITKDNIKKLSVPSVNSTIFELIEVALTGQVNKALRLYDEQKILNVDAVQIINLMSWQLNIIAIIKSSKGKSMGEVASTAKINPYSLNKAKKIADHMTYDRLKIFINELYEIDKRQKTTSFDTDQALQAYIMSLAE